jgi:hypothetical protein
MQNMRYSSRILFFIQNQKNEDMLLLGIEMKYINISTRHVEKCSD